MKPAFVLGLDLAGPANTADTAGVLFAPEGTRLRVVARLDGGDDADLLAWLGAHVPGDATLVAGLDAPLSTNPGGGDRPGDKALRNRLTAAGLPAGTVMTPTMTRMAYLTLRGLGVARVLVAGWPAVRIAEVHPGGALVLRGADVARVRDLKRSASARAELLAWLAGQGLSGLPTAASDHAVAALAAGLAAHHWVAGRPVWRHPAAPPLHPHDIAC